MISNKMVLVITMLLFSFIGQAQVINCEGGLQFDVSKGYLSLPMNSITTHQVDTYLYKNYSEGIYYATGFEWSSFHNAFLKSNMLSTVKLYKYNNGEKAFSLVLIRTGYETRQIKFGNCNF